MYRMNRKASGRSGFLTARRVFLSIALLLLGPGLLGCYNHFSPTPMRWQDDYAMERKFLDVDRVRGLELNATSTKEVLGSFGKEYDVLMTYSPPLPAEYEESYYPIDKRITYFAARIRRVSNPGVNSYSNEGWRVVSFFFYRDRLKWYTIYDTRKGADERHYFTEAITTDLKDIGDGEFWLNSRCTNVYYEAVVLGINRDEAPAGWGLRDPCYFEEPGFEEKLNESGYYAKIANGYESPMARKEKN